ncbi:MAG: hypothetical protein ABJB05_05200 [Parafilimonas sp.]
MIKQPTANDKWSTVSVVCSAIKLLKQALLIFTFYFSINALSAQSVSASLDRDKILLGEQVTLQLNAGNISNLTSFVTNWPQLPDTLSHTEILKRTAIDTITVNDVNAYQQSFTLTCFDSGVWQLGPFLFVIQDKVSGKQLQLATQPVFLTVLPVDVSSLKNYHPLKDIINVETSFNWLPIIIAIGVILIAVIIFVFIKKRKKKITTKPKIILKGTALQRALEKLLVLEKQPLSSAIEIKKFHSETDFIIRQYFEEMMQLKAMQLTATELVSRLSVYMQDKQLRLKFQRLFELNASVKFAKYLPEATESRNTLKEIIRSLQQIDESVNEARHNANRMV